MRRARPTLAVINNLSTGWPHPHYKDQLNEQDPADWPDLADLDHPIIAAAAAAFPGGDSFVADTHQSSTQAAARRVWEVRKHGTGPGWRGAVIMDDSGDPRLVYADTHNSFHNRAANVLARSRADGYLPQEVDYQLRAVEDAKHRVRRWQSDVVMATLRLLIVALENGSRSSVDLPTLPGGEALHVEIEISGDERDIPSLTIEELHSSAAEATITLWLEPLNWTLLDKSVVGLIVPLFESDPARADPNYTNDGRLVLNFVVAHSRLAQLVAAAQTEGMSDRAHALIAHHLPTVAHYADKTTVTRAHATGEVLRAVCGIHFSPSRDTDGLPICQKCEDLVPAAQLLITLRRRTIQIRN